MLQTQVNAMTSSTLYKITSKRGQPLNKEQKAGSQVCPLLHFQSGLAELIMHAMDIINACLFPADYNGAAQTVTLNGANPIMNVLIDIVNDRICEGNENFQVFLTTPSDGCGIANGSSPIDVTIQDDEIGTTGGDDPHFSIVLPGGKMLCYTVQGEHGFSFNLIANERLIMNAKFVPDSRRSEVTWMGSMGIIVKDNTYKQANATNFRFEARSKKIFIGDKVELAAKNLERLTFKNGKLTISEAPPVEGFRYPSIYVDLKDVEIAFTMKFMSEHLDIFWHKTGDKTTNSHGIIGKSSSVCCFSLQVIMIAIAMVQYNVCQPNSKD